MKIRSRLTINLGIFILFSVTTLFVLNYLLVRNTLIDKANADLIEMEKLVYRSVQAMLDTAIRNYLRGITRANLKIVEELYDSCQKGEITEVVAKQRVQEIFATQKVGEMGYLVAVERKHDKLYLDVHPYLQQEECTYTEGCQAWDRVRNGYTEYDWKNPLDNSERKKAAYVLEFTPWNWIIGASSYRDDFVSLVKIDDLKALLNPIRINTSGYFFIFDKNFKWVIHPVLERADLKPDAYSQQPLARDIMKKLLADEDGYMTYLWQNPDESAPRLKYAFIEHLEDFDWYLVASGYYSEVLAPINSFKKITVTMVSLACVVLLILIYRLSRSITEPLVALENGVTDFYQTNRPLTWQLRNIKEIDVLGTAFARMTRELTGTMHRLRAKVNELASSEKEKETNRKLLGSIINSMPSAIIGVDGAMRISQWNNQATKLFGKQLAEVQHSLLPKAIPELTVHLNIISQSLATNSVHTFEFSPTSLPDQEQSIFEITVYPMKDEEDRGAVIRIDDITVRVEMEQKLRQSQKMDAIGQLAGGIAHDFNNMLSGIMGSAELLRNRVSAQEQQLVSIITSAAGRASELILKLLAFSRKDQVAFTPVNLHTVILDTVEILERTLDKKITVKHQLLATSHTVMGDWSQLQNSLLNIGINSGHAMPNGGILEFLTRRQQLDELSCEQSTFALKPGWYIQVVIRDTGCGISKEHLKKIFEPFFTTREQGKGTGLGLAAVYGTVAQHRGAVSVYSEVGIGAEFHILLPLSFQEESQPTAEEQTIVHGEGTILIIDDEPIVRTSAKLMLEKLGYSVIEATDGVEGRNMFRDHADEIDLVLLDMIMPRMDGTRCFYELQDIDPAVKVIICSGFSRDADLKILKNDGLQAFLRKPFNLFDLSRTIAAVLKD